jgi:hypothetical protein
MQLPQTRDKKWKSSPADDSLADLIMTRGVGFTHPEMLSIGKKPIVLYTNNDESSVGLLLSVQSDENSYYFVTHNGVYQISTFGAAPAFSKITTTGAPNSSLGRDAVVFNGNLNVAGGDLVKFFSSGIWNAGITTGTLNSSYPIRLCNFVNKRNLAVGNANKVYLYDTSYALQTTLVLPAEFVVTGMSWRQNSVYIFTRNVSGGTAMMFVWNGAGTEAQFGYGVQADWIYAGCEYDNTIAIVTSAGQLLTFNGGGFSELANFPVYETPYSWSSSSSLINATGKINPRGMTAIGKRLLINLDGSISVQGGGYPGVYLTEQPSGVWEYNPDNGLYHKAGYCHTKYSTLTVTEVASNRLAFASSHGCATGDAVYLNAAGSITGVVAGQTYFAIIEASTSFQLALSPADAAAGKALALSGTANSASVCVESTNEVGATLITAPGAIGLINKNVENVFFGTSIFFGGETPDNTGSNTYSFMSLGLGRSRAVAATRQLPASSLADTFKMLYLIIDTITQAADSIVVKYRTKNSAAYPTQVSSSGSSPVTWASSTSFTVPAANRDLSSVQIGDEMTVIQGAGAGYTAHVLSTALSGGTWTVTVDEAIGVVAAGNKSEVQFDNWTKAGTVASAEATLPDNYAQLGINKASSWIQLKLEERGRDVSIPGLILTNTPNRTP